MSPRFSRRLVAAAVAAATTLALGTVPAAGAEPADPTATLTGRLVAPGGGPAPGFTVVACTGTSGCALGTERAVESAADGTFTLDDVLVGPVLVDVLTLPEDSGQDELMWLEPEALTVDETGADLGDLVLEATPVVTGTVVDGSGPVAGATVRFDDVWYAPTTVSRADGTFRIRPQARGRAQVSVTTDRHVRRTQSVDLGTGSTSVDTGTWSLETERRVSGVVRTTTGGLVEGALVTLWTTGSPGTAWQGHTNRDGTFLAAGVPFGTYNVSASIGSTHIHTPTQVTLDARSPQVSTSIVMVRPAGLAVRLTTSDGQAVTDAHPELEVLVDGRWTLVGSLSHTSDGRYRSWAHLAPGTYRAIVGGELFDQVVVAPTALAEGDETDLGTSVVRRYTATDKHAPTLGTPVVADGAPTYDPDRWVQITAAVSGLKPGVASSDLGVHLVDDLGNTLTSGDVHGSTLTAYLPRQRTGTFVVRFVLDADRHHHRAESAPVTVTIARAATSLGAARASRTTARWGQGLTVSADHRGNPHARVQLLVDGKVRSTTVGRPDGGGPYVRSTLSVPVDDLPVGTHTLALRTLPTDSYAGATSRPVKVTITRGRLLGRPVVKASTVKRGSKPRVTVTLPRADGGPLRFGTVRIYVDGKVVRTVKVTAKTRGRIVATLPVRPRSTFKVKAVYVSSSKLSGATSRTTTVKVRR